MPSIESIRRRSDGIAERLRIPIRNYPSGEPLIGFNSGGEGNVERVLLKPMAMLDFMAGLFFVDAIAERGHPTPALVLPFVPGARQDRLNVAGDFLFTAKSVAKEINARCFPSVTILDPHSEVMPALIDRCRVVHADRCLALPLGYADYRAVISPDAGAEKRASAVARLLGVPLLHAWKTRDVATGAISGFGLEPTFGAVVSPALVVDDICDGGGTFVGLAQILSARGIGADLFVTHGLFTQGTSKLLEHYGNIFCTDSVDVERPGVTVIEVCSRLLEGVF